MCVTQRRKEEVKVKRERGREERRQTVIDDLVRNTSINLSQD